MRKLLFVGPVLTASGYGTHARQILRALVDSGNYDVHVESIRWGETSFLHTDEVGWIHPFISRREAAGDTRYDISVQVTIPNEFRRLARLNVGITAGIEVDRVSPTWLVKTNDEVDVLIVPSYHSAQTFTNTKYRSQDGQVLSLQRPIMVIPETYSDEYRGRVPLDREFATVLNGLSIPDKNLLVVGLGLDKPLGEDRKNISNTVLWFLKEFAGRTDVGLILKTSVVNGSLLDLETTKRRIKELRELSGVGDLPRISLIHGRLTDTELAELYRDPRVCSLVSLTHGEGFGLPLLEAAACGLDVVATDWSGHLDFLTINGEKMFRPVSHSLREIPDSCVWDGVMDRGSKWADVAEETARSVMRAAVEEAFTEPVLERTKRLALHIRENYSPSRLQRDLVNAIDSAWAAVTNQRPETREELIVAIRQQLNLRPDQLNVLFTMPMSGGDVYLSTGVVGAIRQRLIRINSDDDGNLRKPIRLIYATSQRYAEILEGNEDIDEVIDWQPWMQDVGLLEDIFDDVYTPNLAIQMAYSNWVHRGKGRNLFHEMAVQCGLDSDHDPIGPLPPRIALDPVEGLPERYIVVHTGAGKGQWGARRYNHWQDVVDCIRPILAEEGVEIVQVGLPDEPNIVGTHDLRGRTTYRQLAYVVSKAQATLSIDSIVMHFAGHMAIPHIALFGGSYAKSTGTAYSFNEALPGPHGAIISLTPRALIETDDRMGCDRACYKNECKVDPENPCINNIDPRTVVYNTVLYALGGPRSRIFPAVHGDSIEITEDMRRFDVRALAEKARSSFSPRRPRISGYTHVLNAKSQGYPFIESIRSMLGFCTEVVVIDGGSTDGTLEDIRELGDDRVKVIENQWDPDEPGMDGMQKAFGRVMCDPSAEFLWQQDVDEVVHEDDYERVIEVARRFPQDVPLIHLPVVELWGDSQTVRTDRHAWKWRLSRNEFNVTHGIVKHARVLDPKTGRVYSKPGMSDGCEYIDVMTGEYIPHRGFWSNELEQLRQRDPEAYGARMNEVFGKLPVVFHYSWMDIPRKIRNFRDFWDRQWSRLYGEKEPTRRFPDVNTDDDILRKAEELRARGGEHGSAKTFRLERTNPAIMQEWIERSRR